MQPFKLISDSVTSFSNHGVIDIMGGSDNSTTASNTTGTSNSTTNSTVEYRYQYTNLVVGQPGLINPIYDSCRSVDKDIKISPVCHDAVSNVCSTYSYKWGLSSEPNTSCYVDESQFDN